MPKLTYFKPSDFAGKTNPNEDLFDFVCRKANAKLNEALGEQVNFSKHRMADGNIVISSGRSLSDTKTAYLFNIQPIKECEHKNKQMNYFIDGTFSGHSCIDCNKQLEPTGWRVRE